MRKLLTTAIAALALVGGTVAATSADAQVRYRRDNDAEVAIIAGAAGLALGAALSSNRGSRNSGYYGGGYGYPRYDYDRGYGYGYPRYGYDNRRYDRRYRDRSYDRRYYSARPRVCTDWAYDRWGRAYPVQRYC